ncbi:MAG: hypothetical protein IKM54_03680 [Butyricicoccus sp.]|nr:hypothetical protein [Butyricicoccus sp.]
MKSILYGLGVAAIFMIVGCFLVGYLSEIVFVGALLAGLIVWGVDEIKETIYYYYERLKEDKDS